MKKLMIGKYFLIVLWTVIAATALCGGAENSELSAQEFLHRVCHPQGQKESYATMEGKSRHVRRGNSPQESQLYVGIRFFPERTLAQVIVNGLEGYFVGQAYQTGVEGSSLVPMREGGYPDSELADFGLRPQDLTLAFIYWPFVEERPEETCRTIACRVMHLISPDGAERVLAYLSKDAFFPVKAEFFAGNDPECEQMLRTLEISSVVRTGDFVLPKKLNLFGPGWKTEIRFDQYHADWWNSERPAEVFRKVAEQEI